MSELFDNYGLRVKIIADYKYEDDRIIGHFDETTYDPSLDDLLKTVIRLVEGHYDWGIARKDVIEHMKTSLDGIYREYVGPVYSLPEDENEEAKAE